MRYLLWSIIILAAIFVGYNIGKIFTKRGNKTEITENYSFVREIAELASIEVSGTTSLNSSNVSNDGSFTDEIKRIFSEKTIRLSAPYTAKYGVNLKDSSLRIVRTDSTVKIYLPPPTLLSYEIHLDRLETSNRKGWFQFENDEAYTAFQKKMYSEGRGQLEKNDIFLKRSRDKICGILQRYYAPLHIRTICIYDESILNASQSIP